MKKYYTILALSLLLLCQCSKKPLVGEKTARDILVYIIADNNLASNLDADINEMEAVWNESYDGRLFVFHNTGKNSILYRIKHDTDLKHINSEPLIQFNSDFDPCKKGSLTEVMQFVKASYPANQHALVISSHGSGWLPNLNYTSTYTLDQHSKLLRPTQAHSNDSSERTIGSTYKHVTEIEMYDLATMLESFEKLEFIMFDACLMASVEGLYQLRNSAKFIISSSAEILANGAPYDKMMPHMFAKNAPDVKAMANDFLLYYAGQSSEVLRSATISVVQTDRLETLANTIKQIIPQSSINSYTTAGVQQFGRYPYQDTFYDLEDFITKNYNHSPDINNLQAALDYAVVYSGATDYMFKGAGGFKINTHCGLTMYAPLQNTTARNRLNIYNTKYDWGKDSNLSTVFAY